MSRRFAPLYTDAFHLCAWIQQRMADKGEVLPNRLCASALDLLGAVTLALNGRGREEQIEYADDCLILLRTQIRLAMHCGHLAESQMLYALERADAIGRQLGGWKKSLEAG